MLNWPGFLKWSLSHHDETKQTEIPKLSNDQKAWLEEVIKESSLDHNKQLKSTLDKLVEITAKIQENGITEEINENLMVQMENLRELLANLDAGMNFTKMGGVHFLLDKACVRQLPVNFRYEMLSVLMEVAQNNDFVQKMLINNKFTRLIALLFENEDDLKMQYRVIGALKAIIGGKNIVLKRLFMQSKVQSLGIETPSTHRILELLQTKADSKTLKRAFLLFEDLYRYRPFMMKKMDTVPNEQIKPEIFPDHKPFLVMEKYYNDLDALMVQFLKAIINKFFLNTGSFESLDLVFKMNFFYLLKSFGLYVNKKGNLKNELVNLDLELKVVYKKFIMLGSQQEMDPDLKSLISECIKITKTFN
jgi:hypothetical protein